MRNEARFQNGETAWPSGFRGRSPDRPASVRETAWRWPSTAPAASSCARPGEGTNCRSWFPGSRPGTVTGKQTGDSHKAGNPGEGRFCTGSRRFCLADVRPQAGRERARRRPALVLSPRTYNAKSGLALVCPITNQAKGYPFEVAVTAGPGATGVILADHLKSIDWKARRAEKLGQCATRSYRRGAGQTSPAARVLKPQAMRGRA